MEYRTDEANEKIETILRELCRAAIWFIVGMIFAVVIYWLIIETKGIDAPLSNYLGYYFLCGSVFSGIFLFIRYTDERRYNNIKSGKMSLYSERVLNMHMRNAVGPGRHIRNAVGPGYFILFISPVLFVWLLFRRLYQLFKLRKEKVSAN